MLEKRQRSAEWMDDPGADPEHLRKSLRFLRRVNRFLGYSRTSLAYLKHFSRTWKRGEQISIIDLGTGTADIPLDILRWADRNDWDIRIVGIDLHAETAAAAVRESGGESRLTIVQGNVLEMPFADASFDYAMTAMFLHHLADDEVAKVLSTMNRLSRRGIIAADLLRSPFALRCVRCMTLLSNPMVRHDGAASIRQAFTIPEIISLRDQTGLSYATCRPHFGFRFVLAGEK